VPEAGPQKLVALARGQGLLQLLSGRAVLADLVQPADGHVVRLPALGDLPAGEDLLERERMLVGGTGGGEAVLVVGHPGRRRGAGLRHGLLGGDRGVGLGRGHVRQSDPSRDQEGERSERDVDGPARTRALVVRAPHPALLGLLLDDLLRRGVVGAGRGVAGGSPGLRVRGFLAATAAAALPGRLGRVLVGTAAVTGRLERSGPPRRIGLLGVLRSAGAAGRGGGFGPGPEVLGRSGGLLEAVVLAAAPKVAAGRPHGIEGRCADLRGGGERVFRSFGAPAEGLRRPRGGLLSRSGAVLGGPRTPRRAEGIGAEEDGCERLGGAAEVVRWAGRLGARVAARERREEVAGLRGRG